MRIAITVKSVGGKTPLLGARDTDIPAVGSLRELVAALVRTEVAAFNARPVDMSAAGTAEAAPCALLTALSPQQVEEGAAAGKVGFGLRRNPRDQDADAAVETALLAFEDGLFRVFCNDAELRELDAPLRLREGDALTFIRLTMLAGYRWRCCC